MNDGTELAPDGGRWLPAPGFPDYLICYDARVWSIPRLDSLGRQQGGFFMSTPVGSHGYPEVNLARDGKGHTRTVHSLVAEAFLGPCPDGLEVRHKNGVATQCSADNLIYGTSSENQFDKVRHGTHHFANRDRCKQGHLLGGANLIIRLAPDGSFKQRVCVQCREDAKAAWSASKPPCSVCGGPQMAKGLCNKHYQQQRAASRRAAATGSV